MKKAVLIGALLSCIDRMIINNQGGVNEITILVDMNDWKWSQMSASASSRIIELLQAHPLHGAFLLINLSSHVMQM